MAVPDGKVWVWMKTGVAPMKFAYSLEDVEGQVVLDLNKDVYFTEISTGRTVFHPRENIITVEIGG